MIAASVDISFDKLRADYREFICQIFARVGASKDLFGQVQSVFIYVLTSCLHFNVDMMILLLFANS